MLTRISRSLILIFLAVLILSNAAFASNFQSAKFVAKPYKRVDSIPGELIVKFKDVPNAGGSQIMTFSDDSAENIIKKAKIIKIGRGKNDQKKSNKSSSVNTVDRPGLYKLKFDESEDIYSIKKKLLEDPSVEYVEPNYVFQIFVSPNDPNYKFQWGFGKVGAPGAWDVQTGDSSIVIAVIDTGVDYNHQDLAPNIWINENEFPGNGIDDDGNGFVDDVRGWDFVDVPAYWVYAGEDGADEDNDPMDFLGHGTHVAGIAAGKSNNGIGTAGMSWDSKIMPIRAGYLAYDGYGYLELVDCAEAIYYAADNGADIINMSWGSLYNSVVVSDAINYAHSKGCILVASSGNVDGYNAQKPFYPAANDHVIAVSSTDENDKISIWNFFAFSNFGSFVDISAPGTNILSTIPGSSYGYGNGTSMAAPFVSGAAALIESKYPDWTAEQIEQYLKDTSDDISHLNKSFLVGMLGAGRLNIQKALGNLKMGITYPRPSSILSSSTVIKGTANIDNFKEYKIEYASYDDPENWEQIGNTHTEPVENGLLEVWHITNPNGNYYIKLTVENTSGESYSTIAGVNFGIDGEVLLGADPMSGPNPYDPFAGNYLFYYDLLNASTIDIYVYNLTGTLVWEHNKYCNPGVNRVWWDGISNFGNKIGNGVYLYMIIAEDRGQRKVIGRGKIAVVKS